MTDDALAAAANVYEATVLTKPTTLDDFAASHETCANRLAELEATVALLEAENARLKTDLGAASFVAGERARNGIVRWLDEMSRDCDHVGLTGGALIRDLSRRIAACEDINPP